MPAFTPKLLPILEVAEETGLEIEIIQLLDLIFNPPNEQGGADIFILYEGKLIGGDLQAGDDADSAQFFSKNKLPQLALFNNPFPYPRLDCRHSIVPKLCTFIPP